MANSRFYSSTAQQTTLTGGVTSSGTSIAVASTTGFPGSLPFTLALDYGSSNEELVEVTAVASLTLTVTRAIDGTSGSAHSAGAFVRHVSSARDFTDSRTHEAASTNVHGLTGGAAVVGTTQAQTLTNKTLTKALGSLQNITMFNAGVSGITQIIGDSLNPNASRLEIKDNESALNTMIFVRSNGNLALVRNAADLDNTYRIRLTESDQTTDRFYVLAGGTVNIAPTAATTGVSLDIVAPDTSTTKRAFRIAASGGGTERFTVFNDGRVAIAGNAAAQNQLTVAAATAQSVDIMRVTDSTGTLFSVGNAGKTVLNRGAIVAQPGTTSGAVLQVGGSNAGYTGNLEQWVSPSNTIVAKVDETGIFTFTADPLFNGATTWTTYTPTVTGGGTVTWTQQLGWYKKIGKMVFIEIYLSVNAAGSGTTPITIATPSTIFREGAGPTTSRQVILGNAGGVPAGTNSSVSGVFSAVALAGGTGAVLDEVRGPTNISMRGENLGVSTVVTFQGWYREA